MRFPVSGVEPWLLALGLCMPEVTLAFPLDSRQTIDPGVNGTFTASTPAEYTLPDVTVPPYSVPVDMKAMVVGPVGASGSRPLVVFLHGHSSVCYVPNPADPNDLSGVVPVTGWPCQPGQSAFPSHIGYLHIQRLLATQGYLSISILASGLQGLAAFNNHPVDGPTARSNLIRLHLARWAHWSGAGRAEAPAVVTNLPPADMSEVLLFGHSRGGDGVNRAAIDSLTAPAPASNHPDLRDTPASWTIRGIFGIGPVLGGQNPAPDTPSVIILPGCDGDINTLEGELFQDASRGVSRGLALHSSVYVAYANHNWFNSVWVKDNSARDPTCRPGAANRLTFETQLRVGATYVAAAARLFLAPRNTDVLPLLDGSGAAAPPSVSPAAINVHAIGANRLTLVVPTNTTTVTGSGTRLCELVTSGSPTDCSLGSSPHSALAEEPMRPEVGRFAIALAWTAPGTTGTIRPGTRNISGSTHLALRVVVPVATTGTRIEVAIVDTLNRRFVLGEFTLNGLPETYSTGHSNLAQEVRLSLSGSSGTGISLSSIAAVELTPRSSSGTAWLMDAWGWRTGLPDPQPVAMRRVDMPRLVVLEGSGTTTYTLTVPVRGTSTSNGVVRVFVANPPPDQITPFNPISASLVTITPSMTSFNVPITVTGDTTINGLNKTYLLAAKPVQNMFVGDPFGGVTLDDDD